MMNKIFGGMLTVGLIIGLIWGEPGELLEAMTSGMGEAVTLAIGLMGAFMFWMGIMEVAKEVGAIEWLANKTRPLLARLFPKSGDAIAPITLNLAANFFGMGSAATPFGLEAMALLDKHNPTPGVATDAMCMFIALNASALELLPTGVIALRSAAHSTDPYCIILPTFISSVVSFVSAILLCKLFSAISKRRAQKTVFDRR